MRHLVSRLVAASLAWLGAGCTFYTACPTNNGSGATSSMAGNGGSGASGGTSANGGTSGMVVSGSWTNTTSNLASLKSECGNLSFISSKPDEDLLIAGIAQAGLWSSQDGGDSWQALGTGAGSDAIINRTSAIVYDPADTNRFWESGVYNLGGVYETKDDGLTFKWLGGVTHSDLVSIDFSDPDRKTLLAGGHEMPQTLNRSTDGGAHWGPIGSGLPLATNCTTPLIIDPQTYLVGCGGLEGGVTGIYRSTDGGTSWTSITTAGGTGAPLSASDGSIYWASATNAGLVRSTDQGQSFTEVVGAGVLKSLTPVELPDGRIAAVGSNAVLVSADQGATWTAVSPALPYNDVVGLAYSAAQKALFVWHFTCGAPPVQVPADAVMKFPFDYTSM